MKFKHFDNKNSTKILDQKVLKLPIFAPPFFIRLTLNPIMDKRSPLPRPLSESKYAKPRRSLWWGPDRFEKSDKFIIASQLCVSDQSSAVGEVSPPNRHVLQYPQRMDLKRLTPIRGLKIFALRALHEFRHVVKFNRMMILLEEALKIYFRQRQRSRLTDH